MIKIREATIDDLLDIADMWFALEEETPKYILQKDDMERDRFILNSATRFYDKSWFIYVAEEEGRVFGFISGVIRPVEYSLECGGFCESFYVKPTYRTTNAGPMLVDELIKNITKNNECKFLEIVTPNEPRLVRRWERKGWKPSRISFVKEVEV